MSYGAFHWQALQPSPVIGVDEVGRGSLAGPVYAAAVILKSDHHSRSLYTDSKLLSASRRTTLAAEILNLHQVGIGFATVAEIENLNILRASLLAMWRAVQNLGVTTGHVLVDGNQKIPQLEKLFKFYKQTTLIQGDRRAEPVAAASIVAKVTRDRLLCELEDQYPQYGFARHKGYSTASHRAAILRFGVCPEHRKTFANLKNSF